MKKVFLAALLISGGNAFAGWARVWNATSKPLEIEVKWVAETKIGCRPSKFTLKPGKKKAKQKGCNPHYIKFRPKGTKKWVKTSPQLNETIIKYVIIELKDGTFIHGSGLSDEHWTRLVNKALYRHGQAVARRVHQEKLKKILALPPG